MSGKKGGGSKSWFRAVGLNQHLMSNYVKAKQGHVPTNVKLIGLVVSSLEMAGHVRPPNASDRQFICAFAKEIGGEARALKLARRTTEPITPARRVEAVESDSFLSSYAWRRLRMEALKLHGRRCQCCGATPETGAVINVDHIKPRKLFPDLALDLTNLQVLCHECNHGKGNWDQTDWRPKVDNAPAAS